ncbi:hypothetical protein [Candidatus Gromoviella agglomerans]|uniref:hypothetical protein n=1 Tax=Candidatus Gromoviella agglomerans TaxID=2806609 RepID=UPI001E40DE80|nr:hypothetical protein [Candidatus Gromoviella agglomerans]UFX98484.1 hypothetical protein Gromo_00394 [Candidatus Gromoviella agglomerans]
MKAHLLLLFCACALTNSVTSSVSENIYKREIAHLPSLTDIESDDNVSDLMMEIKKLSHNQALRFKLLALKRSAKVHAVSALLPSAQAFARYNKQFHDQYDMNGVGDVGIRFGYNLMNVAMESVEMGLERAKVVAVKDVEMIDAQAKDLVELVENSVRIAAETQKLRMIDYFINYYRKFVDDVGRSYQLRQRSDLVKAKMKLRKLELDRKKYIQTIKVHQDKHRLLLNRDCVKFYNLHLPNIAQLSDDRVIELINANNTSMKKTQIEHRIEIKQIKQKRFRQSGLDINLLLETGRNMHDMESSQGKGYIEVSLDLFKVISSTLNEAKMQTLAAKKRKAYEQKKIIGDVLAQKHECEFAFDRFEASQKAMQASYELYFLERNMYVDGGGSFDNYIQAIDGYIDSCVDYWDSWSQCQLTNIRSYIYIFGKNFIDGVVDKKIPSFDQRVRFVQGAAATKKKNAVKSFRLIRSLKQVNNKVKVNSSVRKNEKIKKRLK